MAAVLQPHPDPRSSQRPALRLVGAPIQEALPTRPVLRVVHGGRSTAVRRRTFLVRRLAVASVLMLGIVGLGVLVAPGSDGAAGSSVAVAERSVVVGSGDTLWGIAASIAPDADPRDTVDAILAANDLDGPNGIGAEAQLRVGQRIVLPPSVR